jgi:hypothetical protein
LNIFIEHSVYLKVNFLGSSVGVHTTSLHETESQDEYNVVATPSPTTTFFETKSVGQENNSKLIYAVSTTLKESIETMLHTTFSIPVTRTTFRETDKGVHNTAAQELVQSTIIYEALVSSQDGMFDEPVETTTIHEIQSLAVNSHPLESVDLTMMYGIETTILQSEYTTGVISAALVEPWMIALSRDRRTPCSATHFVQPMFTRLDYQEDVTIDATTAFMETFSSEKRTLVSALSVTLLLETTPCRLAIETSPIAESRVVYETVYEMLDTPLPAFSDVTTVMFETCSLSRPDASSATKVETVTMLESSSGSLGTLPFNTPVMIGTTLLFETVTIPEHSQTTTLINVETLIESVELTLETTKEGRYDNMDVTRLYETRLGVPQITTADAPCDSLGFTELEFSQIQSSLNNVIQSTWIYATQSVEFYFDNIQRVLKISSNLIETVSSTYGSITLPSPTTERYMETLTKLVTSSEEPDIRMTMVYETTEMAMHESKDSKSLGSSLVESTAMMELGILQKENSYPVTTESTSLMESKTKKVSRGMETLSNSFMGSSDPWVDTASFLESLSSAPIYSYQLENVHTTSFFQVQNVQITRIHPSVTSTTTASLGGTIGRNESKTTLPYDVVSRSFLAGESFWSEWSSVVPFFPSRTFTPSSASIMTNLYEVTARGNELSTTLPTDVVSKTLSEGESIWSKWTSVVPFFSLRTYVYSGDSLSQKETRPDVTPRIDTAVQTLYNFTFDQSFPTKYTENEVEETSSRISTASASEISGSISSILTLDTTKMTRPTTSPKGNEVHPTSNINVPTTWLSQDESMWSKWTSGLPFFSSRTIAYSLENEANAVPSATTSEMSGSVTSAPTPKNTSHTISTEGTDINPISPTKPCPHPLQTYYPKCDKCLFRNPIDCNGECGLYTLDCMGECRLKTLAYVRDCEGSCFKPNDIRLKTLDACKVCGGDNSTCTDCRGVLFGKAKRDNCGVCEGDDTTCFLVSKFFPYMTRNMPSIKIQLRGARLRPDSLIFNGTDYSNTLVAVTWRSSFAEFVVTGVSLGNASFVTLPVNISGFDPIKGSLSFVFNLTLYDPQTQLYSIRERINPVGISIRLGLTGVHFFSYPWLNCAFEDENDVFVSPLTIENSTFGWCLTPVRNQSRSLGLNVNVLYGPDIDRTLFLPRDERESFLLMYYESAPAFDYCNFSYTGSEISLFFNKPVQHTKQELDLSKRNPCNLFISHMSSNGRQFWIQPQDCSVYFADPKIMSIILDPRFIRTSRFVVPGLRDEIRILDGVFGTRDAVYSFTASGGRLIEPPNNAAIPIIAVSAPRFIDGCTDLTFDLTQTSGSGGRPFVKGDFSVMTSFDNHNATGSSILQTKLEEFKNAILSNTQSNVNPFEFTLERDLLPEGQYTFLFSLTNFLQQEGRLKYTVTKSSSLYIPSLLYRVPESVQVNQVSQVKVKVFEPCHPALGDVVTRWTSLEATYVVSEADASRRALIFPPYSLRSDSTYTFILSYWYSAAPSDTYNNTITVKTGSRKLEVELGSGKTVTESGRISLLANVRDSALSANQLKRFLWRYSFEWYCVNEEYDQCISKTSGEELNFEDNQRIDIQNVLEVGTYYFFVTVSTSHKGVRISSDSALTPVVVTAENQLSISIRVSDSNPGSFSNFALESIIENTPLGGLTQYVWLSKAVCDKENFMTIDLSDNFNVLANGRTLKFAPGSLVPGGTYCFGLQLAGMGEGQFSGTLADVRVVVKRQPSSGYCDVIGDNVGTAFMTLFRFSCSGWETDISSYPLSYVWDIKYANTSVWTQLSPLAALPSISLWLPIGNYSVRATIVDSAGSRNFQEQVMPVTVFENKVPKSLDLLANESVTRFYRLGDAEQLLSELCVISMMYSPTQELPSKRRSYSMESTLLRTLSMLQGLTESNTVYLGREGASSILLDVLVNTVGFNHTLSPPLLTAVSSVLQAAILSISANTEESSDCIGRDYGQKVVEILDVLLRSSEAINNQTVAKTTLDVLNLLQKCMLRELSCDQRPTEFESSSLNRAIGVIDVYNTNTACGFQFEDLTALFSLHKDVLDELGCVSFACGVSQSAVLVHSTNNSVSPIIKELTFADSRLSGNTSIIFSVPIERSFAARYNLSTYNLTHPKQNEWQRHRVKPLCVYYAGMLGDTSGMWSSEGCQPIGFDENENSLLCNCSHLTAFGVQVVSVPPPQQLSGTFSPSGTGNPGGGQEGGGEGGGEGGSLSPKKTEPAEPTNTRPNSEDSGISIGVATGVTLAASILAVFAFARYRINKQKNKVIIIPAIRFPPGVRMEGDINEEEDSESELLFSFPYTIPSTNTPEFIAEETMPETSRKLLPTANNSRVGISSEEPFQEVQKETGIGHHLVPLGSLVEPLKSDDSLPSPVIAPLSLMDPESLSDRRHSQKAPKYTLPPTYEQHVRSARRARELFIAKLSRLKEEQD